MADFVLAAAHVNAAANTTEANAANTDTVATSTSTSNGPAVSGGDNIEDQQHDNTTDASTHRGRSKLIMDEDSRFTKKAISPSPSRSSLSAALHHAQAAQHGQHAHALGLGHGHPVVAASASSSPSRASPAPGSHPDSGSVTPADLTNEDHIARLKLKISDLSSQVTSLNGKLVQSYNRVGNLEEDADMKMMEIKNLASKIEKLEADRKTWEDKYEGGLLVEKDHVQTELTRMMDRVIEETASRGKAENDKAQIERELEQLSSQLFQEANNMVALERMSRLKAERKMEELELNFKDTETMMLGQSSQMREMGNKLEDLEHERDELRKQIEELQQQQQNVEGDDDDGESIANASTISIRSENAGAVPSSFPDVGNSMLSSSVASQPSLFLQMPLPGGSLAPGTPGSAVNNRSILFAHPIQFLSIDLPPFQEFVMYTKSIARVRRTIMSRPIIDPSSNNPYGYTGFPAPYAAGGMNHAASFPGYLSEAERQSALKEALPLSQYLGHAFVKRIQEEDSDPTLRLESAPGLSFFNRRQIASAIIDGDLAIEPAHNSLPSDKCSLCGTSLAKFIASHQVTQPKDDPRKKLTRLATGWIPSAISGTATPTKEGQDKGSSSSIKDQWSISALSDALGALTPSRELGGFSFGMSSEKEKASQGHYTPYNPSTNSNSRPGTSSGSGQKRPSFGTGAGSSSGTPHERQSSLPPLDRKTSTSGKPGAAAEGDGVQHDYVLTQSARQQGQIYLFRSLDSSTRYTLCPHYCLPRLRAVCELWTYIRTIHKGLLLEENPKIYPSPFGTSNEYTKLFRRLTANLQVNQNVTNVIQNIATPAAGVSRQLGDSAFPPPSSGLSQSVGSSTSRSESASGAQPPIITTTNSLPGLNTNMPVGLGLDMESRLHSEPSEIGASSASSTTGDDENSSAGKESQSSSAASSTDNLSTGQNNNNTAEGEKISDALATGSANTTPSLPSRPPRSAARSSPMTPSTSGDGGSGRFPAPPSALSITSLKAADTIESDKTPTQSPEMKQGDSTATPSSSGQGHEKRRSIDGGSDFEFKSPKSPLSGTMSGNAPALPPRSPRFSGGVTRMAPGRISMPTSNLSSSLTSDGGWSNASVGSGLASTTPNFNSAVRDPMSASVLNAPTGPVSTSQADWQQKCWFEVIRLKEGVFWSRVGANYNKES